MSNMTAAKTNALIASAYNLHIQQGDAMTPAKAAKLPRGDRAQLCRMLEERGGSDLYTQDDARAAFALVVESRSAICGAMPAPNSPRR